MSILSSKKVRLKRKAQSGSKGAKIALELAEEPNKFLSTIQVGITLIGIFTGIYGGATFSERIRPWLEQFPTVVPYAGGLSIAIVTFFITYLTLVVGELVPKRIALQRPEALASIFAPIMNAISKVASPFVWLLSTTTDLILKLFGMNKVSDSAVSEEEIKALIEESAADGQIEVTEQKMVEQVFKLSDHTVNELMTSRVDLEWIDINDPLEVNMKIILESNHTHFPVCDGDLDEMLGILNTKDMLPLLSSHKKEINFKELTKEPLFVPETMRPFKLMELFKEKESKFAVVVDEFGTMHGVITLNDLIDDIVSSTSPNDDDEDNPQINKREDGTYFVDGMLSKNELKEFLEVHELLDEDENYYTTAGGFVMYGMKKVPKVGEKLLWERIEFEIADMDGQRVDKIIVKFPDTEVESK